MHLNVCILLGLLMCLFKANHMIMYIVFVQELDLSDNFLSVMEAGSLEGCLIEKLDISYNKLVNVPQISVAGQIKDLLLSANMIRQIDRYIYSQEDRQICRLMDRYTEKLNISYNKLVNVPQISVAGQITDLLLSGNMIRQTYRQIDRQIHG